MNPNKQMQGNQEQQGKAIPFIQILDSNQSNSKNVKFELQQEAISLISQFKDKQISVLVIAGPQRTGKSYLANRILKQQTGFAIGPTTNPCTKGIWIWNKPIHLNPKTVMFILDTEGLNSVQRDKTIDIKIFSISMLLCSMFVYNNIGHIDETALENISLVTKLSENICIKNSGESDSRIGDYLPHFYWVLRDFSLDLKGKTPKQYLDDVLKPVPGQGEDINRKNSIRDKLRTYFISRDCECLVRPLIDEKKLARIEEQQFQDLRPEFQQGVQKFEKKIFQNIQPKSINNKTLTCEMFINLAYEYIQSINSGGVPTILSTLDILIEAQLRKIRDEIRSQYQVKLDQMVPQNKMPMDENEILHSKLEIIKMLSYILEQRVKSIIDIDKLQELKKEFMNIIEQDFKHKLDQNKIISKNVAIQNIQKTFTSFSTPVFNTVDQITPSMISEKGEECIKKLSLYQKQVKGVYGYQIFFEQFPNFIFDYFDKVFDRVQRIYQEDHNKTKVYLQQSRDQEERLRKNVKDFDHLVTELQKERQSSEREIEKLKKQNNKQIELHDYEVQSLKQRLQIYEQHKGESDIQYTQAQQQQFSSIENQQRLKQQINRQELENETLQMRVDELEKLLQDLKYSNNIDESSVELLTVLKELKSQANNMENYFKKKNENNSFLDEYIKERQNIENEKQQLTQKMRNELKEKKEEFRKKLELEYEKQEKKIDILNKYNDQIKSELYELQNCSEQLKLKEQQINNLIQENQQYQVALNAKSANLETHTQALQNYITEIEKLNASKADLETTFGFLKMENGNLMSLKSTYPYVLKESMKYVMNKPSRLKHSINQLDKDDIQQIKDIFQELKISINF